jgi:ATP-binding cassette, subfamily A (ABC1), member 3
MEEVESLATKVTILGTRMLASGSLSSLRSAYGGFYRVRASYGSFSSASLSVGPSSSGRAMTDTDAERLIRDAFREKGIEVINLVARYGQVNFEVPHEVRNLGGIMSAMEVVRDKRGERAQIGDIEIEVDRGITVVDEGDRGAEGGFKEYTIAEPTMEMIFMNVCTREGVEKAVGV